MDYVPPFPCSPRLDGHRIAAAFEDVFGPILPGEETVSILVSRDPAPYVRTSTEIERLRAGDLSVIDPANLARTHIRLVDVQTNATTSRDVDRENDRLAGTIEIGLDDPRDPGFRAIWRTMFRWGRDLRRFEVGDVIVRFDLDDPTTPLDRRRRLVYALDETGTFRCVGSFRPPAHVDPETVR
jgi:hypothetical protein